MKRFHLLAVVAFLLTGKYMDSYLERLRGMPDGPRMLYRTRHIFILLAGLLNLGIGAYFRPRTLPERRIMQILGSIFIVLATVLFVAGFFYEPKLADLDTTLSHWGMYAIFAGTFLHLLSGLGPRGAISQPKTNASPKLERSAHAVRTLEGCHRLSDTLSGCGIIFDCCPVVCATLRPPATI